MADMWKADTYKIGELVNEIERADLVLPQFQRPAVWGRADWIPFLTTVLKNRPTGTLLLLEVARGPLPFAVRPLEGAPVLPKEHVPKHMLLDGQQRSTTLFNALRSGFKFGRGTSYREFVIDVSAARTDGELTEAHLSLVSKAKIKGFADQARSGTVTFGVLFDSALRTPWLGTYAETMGVDLGDLVQELQTVIPGFESLRDYQFPVLKIGAETPLDVVVEIFEGMNRRGQRLNQFDLMVARLYKEVVAKKHYDLRQRWKDSLSRTSNLGLMGITEDHGMLPLQLIAMQVARLSEGARPPNVTGMTNRDVLNLPSEYIIGTSVLKELSLETAVNALEEAATFLWESCGVRSGNLLPQVSMLLPIADQMLSYKKKRLDKPLIRRWFFTVGLQADYYGSVNFYVHRDCEALTEWATKGETPASVSSFDGKAASDLDLMQSMTREGDIVGKTLMALLVSAGARDWCGVGPQIKDSASSVDFHHMLPAQNQRRDLGIPDAELNPIVGFTPLTSPCNRSLGNQLPSVTIAALARNAEAVFASHCVDPGLLESGLTSKAAREKLLTDRQERLRTFVAKELGV